MKLKDDNVEGRQEARARLLLLLLTLIASVAIMLHFIGGKPPAERTAKSRLAFLATRITEYHNKRGMPPSSMEDVHAFLGTNAPNYLFVDPWGHNHIYKILKTNADSQTASFVVESPGPNGTLGDKDDILLQERFRQ